MRKTVSVVLSMVLTACRPLAFAAQSPAVQPEGPSPENLRQELSPPLPLDPARRAEVEDSIRSREYKCAEAILVEEADRNPQFLEAARLLELAGGLFFLDGQYLNSAVAWKKAEAIHPLNERNRFTLAMAYVKLNRPDWARSQLEQLDAAHPRNPLYVYWLARLDYDAQNYASAIARLKEVLQVDPGMVRAYDLLGLCYDYLGQADAALKNYARAVALNRLQSKPSPWPHVDFAITLAAVNQLNEAEENLREALKYGPRLPQAHYQLGRILLMRGEYEAAIQPLSEASQLDRTYAEPHYLLGRIYQRLGRRQLAKAEIERFRELNQAREASATTSSPPPQKGVDHR